MPLLIQKSMDELMQTAMARLAQTPISETSPGGIARLFLAVINEQLATDAPDGQGFYKALQLAHAQAFLSTAEGENLDLVGMLLNCKRRAGESDNDFRYRISQQALTLATANQTAVRLAALSVPGVKDVIMKPFTHGTGSGSLYVINDNPAQTSSIIAQVQSTVNEVVAYGVRVVVFAPTAIPVEMRIRLIFDKKASDVEQKLIRTQATQALKDYVNSRSPGDSLVVNEVVQRVMQVSDLIFDVEILSMAVGDRPAQTANQTCAWNERFVESSRPNALIAA